MTMRLDRAGAPILLPMGSLSLGAWTYRAEVPRSCQTGCRLAAVSIGHAVSDLDTATAQVSLHRISAGPTGDVHPLDTAFDRATFWHAGPATTGGPDVTLRAGTSLVVDLVAPGGFAAEIVHSDAPEPLPAFAGPDAGQEAHEPGAVPTVTSSGLSGTDTSYRKVSSGPLVPRAGAGRPARRSRAGSARDRGCSGGRPRGLAVPRRPRRRTSADPHTGGAQRSGPVSGDGRRG